MGKVRSAQSAGSIVRRVREEKGVSRAELSSETGIGTRTIYALEQGESRNFGLENYLKILAALGLDMSVDLKGSPAAINQPDDLEAPLVPTFELADIWKLDGLLPRIKERSAGKSVERKTERRLAFCSRRKRLVSGRKVFRTGRSSSFITAS